MTTLVAQSSKASSVELLPRRLRDCLALATNNLETNSGVLSLPAEVAPHEADRYALQVQQETLKLRLAPCTDRDIGIALKVLASGLLFQSLSETGTEARVQAYKLVLVGRTSSVGLAKAVERYVRGEIGNKKFAPNPPELLAAANAIDMPFLQEQMEIRKVLSAKVITRGKDSDPERRRALAAEIRKKFGIGQSG